MKDDASAIDSASRIGEVTVESILKWLKERFPSSRESALLFKLAKKIGLPDDSRADHIVISHSFIWKAKEAQLVRSVGMLFSTGPLAANLCPYQVDFYFNEAGEMIRVQETVPDAASGHKLVKFFLADPTKTEPYKFEGMVNKLFELLEHLNTAVSSELLPITHPLLNPPTPGGGAPSAPGSAKRSWF